PGLASPGSIYSSTHGAALLVGPDPEAAYAARLLPVKLALDVVYVRRASLAYDARIVGRTLWVIVTTLVGRRHFPDPPELAEARGRLAEGGPAPAQRPATELSDDYDDATVPSAPVRGRGPGTRRADPRASDPRA